MATSLVPAVIQHNFHTHSLVLGYPTLPDLDDPSYDRTGNCYACRAKIRRSRWDRMMEVYHCNQCPDFYMHIKCALHMPTIRHCSHDAHPLTPLRIKEEEFDIQCNWCGKNSSEEGKTFYGYRCIPCKFYIHETCIKYEKEMVNDDEHHHPLHYFLPTNSSSPNEKQDDQYEWRSGDYCEVCGKDINQNKPIYRCLDCQNEFLFHPDCALTSSQKAVAAVLDDSFLLFHELR